MTVVRPPAKPNLTPAAPPVNLLGYYAGFVSRLMAMVLDTVFISFTFIALTWFVSVTATMLQLRSFLGFSINSIPGSAGFIDALFGPITAGVLTAAYIAGYHIFFWALIGQTPGKALLGLRVVTLDGKRLTPLRGLVRVLGYILSALPLYTGFLWILVDDRRQAFHDKLSGTYVIYTWAARPDERFLVEHINGLTQQSRPEIGPGEEDSSASS